MTLETSELLLLDTHVWIWILNDDPKARRAKALEKVEAAAKQDALRISWVSIWEVSMLEAHKKLVLPVPLSDWIREALNVPGLSMASLDPEVLIESTRLPGQFNSDPMDNILIASARHLNARLVTADRKILHYGQTNFVKVLPFGVSIP